MTSYKKQLQHALTHRRVPQVREAGGKRLAESGHVERLDGGSFLVGTPNSGRRYIVEHDDGGLRCECAEHANRGVKCLHICASEALIGMELRAERAARIVRNGQVHRVEDDFYRVASQTDEGHYYEVRDYGQGWACNCPDHMVTGHRCKHIRAVEFSAGVRQQQMADVEIREVSPYACRKCGSNRVTKDGPRKIKHGTRQRLRCKDCGKRFSDNLGFEKRQSTAEQITLVLNSFFAGASHRKTAGALAMSGCRVSRSTIWRWIDRYSCLIDRHTDDIVPRVGEDWRTDEISLKMKGDKQWLYTMIDSDTRYWLATMVGPKRDTHRVEPMLRKAEEVGGKKPRTFASDGASNFGQGWREVYRHKVPEQKLTRHVSHVHLKKNYNNNQMEAFNGATLRHRLKVTRGLWSADSPVLCGLKVFHNLVRPHQGIGMYDNTPAEQAGITIGGDDKWKTLIQNAALQEGTP